MKLVWIGLRSSRNNWNKNIFSKFCLLTCIRITSKSWSQWTSVLPTGASISSRLGSLMHISFFLHSFLEYKTRRIIRIVSYMYFPHFINLYYVKRNQFMVEIVWKPLISLIKKNHVLAASIFDRHKNVRSSMQSSNFST